MCLYSDSRPLRVLATGLRLASTPTPVQNCLEVSSFRVSFGRSSFFYTFYLQRGNISYFPESGISTEPLSILFMNMAISIVTGARNSNLS
jgi:hypothetical protein